MKAKPTKKRIDWNASPGKEKQEFIINNYKTMRYKEIAEQLKLPYTTIISRITILRKTGMIDIKREFKKRLAWEEKPKEQEKSESKPGGLKLGKKYKIKHRSVRRNDFVGTYEGETKRMHIFVSDANYKKCFLKVDFMIGEYRAQKIN